MQVFDFIISLQRQLPYLTLNQLKLGIITTAKLVIDNQFRI